MAWHGQYMQSGPHDLCEVTCASSCSFRSSYSAPQEYQTHSLHGPFALVTSSARKALLSDVRMSDSFSLSASSPILFLGKTYPILLFKIVSPQSGLVPVLFHGVYEWLNYCTIFLLCFPKRKCKLKEGRILFDVNPIYLKQCLAH